MRADATDRPAVSSALLPSDARARRGGAGRGRSLDRQWSECMVTHMTRTWARLSTSVARRDAVIDAAIDEFARTGYHGTPINNVATRAGISQAYVFKLFPGKINLFVAALDRCFDLVEQALSTGAARAAGGSPEEILHAMGGAYAELIADNSLLMLQVHAQSAADIPEIADALRGGFARVTRFAKARSGGEDAQVQRFIAYGQLCHLITTLDIEGGDGDWAALLTTGIRHPNQHATRRSRTSDRA